MAKQTRQATPNPTSSCSGRRPNGLAPQDREIAELQRRPGRPVVLAVTRRKDCSPNAPPLSSMNWALASRDRNIVRAW
jgi:hypothetical protein